MDDSIRIISTEEELKIFSDPYRLKIISTFQSSDKPLTVKGCADIMKEVPAKVYYHVKKLIKIEILELDHVQVINGINAKYYKLTKQKFSVKLENSDQQNIYRQLNHVQNLLVQVLDDFKQDMIQSTQTAVDEKLDKDSDVGMLSGTYIYLTEEEYREVYDKIVAIIDTYNTKGENKNKYSYIGGLSRIQNKKEWFEIIPFFYRSKLCCL